MTRRSFPLSLVLVLLTLGCSSRGDLAQPSTQLDLGVRAARINLWREALFRFQRAVQMDPANAMARNNLAVAYEGIGEFEKARVEYTEALKLDRANQHIQKNYSRFVEFYTRNKKREMKIDAAKTAATPPAAQEKNR
jgi:Tfp pilus assembly protein PilF